MASRKPDQGPTVGDLLFGLGAGAADWFARWEQAHAEEIAELRERGGQAVRALADQARGNVKQAWGGLRQRLGGRP